jgi:hypothetical protein
MSSHNERLNHGRRTGAGASQLSAIAEAVHQTVCAETSSDGFQHCMLYAIVGAMLASLARHHHYVPQAGTLRLQYDPEDPSLWFALEASRHGILGGEFHSWFGRPGGRRRGGRGERRTAPALEVVDLSSRHYPALLGLLAIRDRQTTVVGNQATTVLALDPERPTWKRTEPCPPYLWSYSIDRHLLPDWVKLVPDEDATLFQVDMMVRRMAFFKRLLGDARERYEALAV